LHADVTSDLTAPVIADGPVGVIDLDHATVHDVAHDGDVAVNHPTGMIEYEDSFTSGRFTAIVTTDSGVPPLPRIAGNF
jgi:hypothetical protein